MMCSSSATAPGETGCRLDPNSDPGRAGAPRPSCPASAACEPRWRDPAVAADPIMVKIDAPDPGTRSDGRK